MPSKVYPSQWGPIPTPDLENWNLDRDVDVPVMVRGGMYKSGGTWYFNDGTTGIKNTSGTSINPATEETLQSVLSAIGGSEYAQKIQVVGSIIYEAKAVIGSAEASAVWQAWKTDATTLTDITVTWADGDKLFNNIATDLSSLSYS